MVNNTSSDLAALSDRDTLLSTSERLNIPHLEYFDDIDSTQNRVRTLAAEGAPEWTVVIADHQTSGRGQHGRTWFSTSGAALMLSVLLKPDTVGAMSLIPIRTGLAVARALRAHFTNTENAPIIQLKWPNDLVVRDGKVGGILCEGQIRGEELAAVVGVGINVRRFDYPILPDAVAPPAFIENEFQKSVHRLDILERITREMRSALAVQSEVLSPEELSEYSRRDWLHGRNLSEPVEGIALGINERGHLAVQRAEGVVEFVIGGSIRVRWQV